MHFCRSVVLDMSLDLKSKSASPSGNRTPVSRVTGGDTYHYTNEDLLPSTDLAQNLVLNIQQFSGLSDAKKFQGAAQVCFKLGSPTIMATHWDKNRHKAHILGMGSFKIRDPKFSHGHSKFKYHVSSKFFFSIQEYIPRNKTQKNQSLKYAGFWNICFWMMIGGGFK